jgi:uncharacterized membrane protein YfcA
MFDEKLIFVAAVFALAGLVKGVIGLGLPTISMGLLAIVMSPLQAAAILVLPSFLTNIWQMIAGPSLKSSVRRLWPFLVALCLGTWAGAGLMTAISARYSNLLLGAALLAYAAAAFRARRSKIVRASEKWLSPIVGVVTGLVTAATGVFVIPAVPYLEAVEMEKEEFIQALGLSFTVSTIALAVNLFWAGALAVAVAGPTLVALAAAGAGMGVGQILRLRLSPAIFRRCFFIGLLLIGLYLVASALV